MEIEVIVHAQKPAWLRELQFDQSGNTEQVTRCKNIVHWMWDRQRTRIKVTLQGFGCSPIKVVRELGSERRETVRFISGMDVRILEEICL